jgi:hypothetical protein
MRTAARSILMENERLQRAKREVRISGVPHDTTQSGSIRLTPLRFEPSEGTA